MSHRRLMFPGQGYLDKQTIRRKLCKKNKSIVFVLIHLSVPIHPNLWYGYGLVIGTINFCAAREYVVQLFKRIRKGSSQPGFFAYLLMLIAK